MREYKELPTAYKLGVESIDKQHAKIIALLEDAVKAKSFTGQNREDLINSIIVELKNYASRHFSYEEKLMVKMQYSDIEKHLKAHKDFVDKISQFQLNTQRYTNENILGLAKFLKEWFLEHINKIDRQYLATFQMYKKLLEENGKILDDNED
jgi:hemerythrin-like metal-binding protein